MSNKLCPKCLEPLERYYMGPDCSIIGETYQEESGWQCPEGHYAETDMPIGCWVVPFIFIVIVVIIKLVT